MEVFYYAEKNTRNWSKQSSTLTRGFYGKGQLSYRYSQQNKPDTLFRNFPDSSACDAFIKHENHNPTGSFKIRGALNFYHSHVQGRAGRPGSSFATRGNHRPGYGLAGQWFHVPCMLLLCRRANNPENQQDHRKLRRGNLIVHGEDFYDAQSYCEELVDSAGYYYVQQGNETWNLKRPCHHGTWRSLRTFPKWIQLFVLFGGGAGCAVDFKDGAGNQARYRG